MKTAKRVISVFMAVMMVFTAVSVVVEADDKNSGVSYSDIGEPVLTAQKSATLLLDYVDELLGKADLTFEIPIATSTWDCTSIDSCISTFYGCRTNNIVRRMAGEGEPSVNYLGDVKYLDVSALKNVKRSGGDLDLIYSLLDFAADNSIIVEKFLTGTLTLGSQEHTTDTPVLEAMRPDIVAMIKGLIFDKLINKDNRLSSEPFASSAYKDYTLDALVDLYAQTALTTDAYLPNAYLKDADTSAITTSSSLNKMLVDLWPCIYKDIIEQPFQSDLKYYIGVLCGVKYNELDSSAVTPELRAAASYETNTLGNNTSFFKYDGKYYFRRDTTFFYADMSSVNSLAKYFDFDYDVTGANGYSLPAGSHDLLSNINSVLYFALDKVLSDKGMSELTALGFTAGGNEQLLTDLTALLRFALPKVNDFVPGILSTDFFTGEAIKTASMDTILINVLRQVSSLLDPGLIIPDDTATLSQLAVIALRQYMMKTVPYLTYDARIFSAPETLISGKDDAYWNDILVTMGVDLGVYYLNEYTDFGVTPEQVLTWKNDGWTWEYFLDEACDWAIRYAGALIPEASKLSVNRGKYDSGGAFRKLDILLNDLLNFSFIHEDGDPFNLSTRQLLLGDGTSANKGLIGYLLDLDLGNALNYFVYHTSEYSSLDTNAGNYFEMPLNKAAISILKSVLNFVFPGTVTYAASSSDLENLIQGKNLADIVNGLLSYLDKNKTAVCDTLLPLIAENVQLFGKAQKFTAPSFGADLDSVTWTGSYTFTVRNECQGLPAGYTGKADHPYVLTVGSVTAVSDDSSAIKVAPQTLKLTNGQSGDITLTGTLTGDALVKVVITYYITGPDGAKISQTDLTQTKYVFAKTADSKAAASYGALSGAVARELAVQRQSAGYGTSLDSYNDALLAAVKAVCGESAGADEAALLANLNTAISVLQKNSLMKSSADNAVGAASLTVGSLTYDKTDFRQAFWSRYAAALKTAQALSADYDNDKTSDDDSAVNAAFAGYDLALQYSRLLSHQRQYGVCAGHLFDAIRQALAAKFTNEDDAAALLGIAGQADQLKELIDSGEMTQCQVNAGLTNLLTEYNILYKAGKIADVGKMEMEEPTEIKTSSQPSSESVSASSAISESVSADTSANESTAQQSSEQPSSEISSAEVSSQEPSSEISSAPVSVPESSETTPSVSDTTGQQPSYVRGDADGDGHVTAADARIALRIAVGLQEATDIQQFSCDADGDGYITAADARFILRLAVGLD